MTTRAAHSILKFIHVLNKVLITIVCGIIITAIFTFFMMGLAAYPVDTKLKLLNTDLRYNEFLKVENTLFRHLICKTGYAYNIVDSHHYKFEVSSSPRGDLPTGPLGAESYIRRIRIRRFLDQQPGPAPGPAEIYLTVSWVCPGNYYQAIFPKTRVIGPLKFNILDEDAPRQDPEPLHQKGD